MRLHVSVHNPVRVSEIKGLNEYVKFFYPKDFVHILLYLMVGKFREKNLIVDIIYVLGH